MRRLLAAFAAAGTLLFGVIASANVPRPRILYILQMPTLRVLAERPPDTPPLIVALDAERQQNRRMRIALVRAGHASLELEEVRGEMAILDREHDSLERRVEMLVRRELTRRAVSPELRAWSHLRLAWAERERCAQVYLTLLERGTEVAYPACEAALRELDRFEREDLGSAIADEAFVLRAQLQVDAGNIADARRTWARFFAGWPRSPHTGEGAFRAADLAFESADFAAAIPLFELAARDAPDAAMRTVARLKSGLSQTRVGQPARAAATFQAIIDERPIVDAEMRWEAIRELEEARATLRASPRH
jgi:hypothetical protein